jgi:hypothetical protein
MGSVTTEAVTTETNGQVAVDHPAWCSPEHCIVQHPGDCADDCQEDHGVRLHQQAPIGWVDDTKNPELRVESQLVRPDDDFRTYVELELRDLFMSSQCRVYMTEATARRLRDLLDEQLGAIAAARRNRLAGDDRRVTRWTSL